MGKNQRRLNLINKRLRATLTPMESEELQDLQVEAEQLVDAIGPRPRLVIAALGAHLRHLMSGDYESD